MASKFIKHHESIIGAIISTIGGVAFSIYGVNEPMPFWITGGITLVALLYIWYQKSQEFYRIEEIRESQKQELARSEEDISKKNQEIITLKKEIITLKKEIDDMKKRLLDYHNLKIDVVDVDVNDNRMRFHCNVNSNVIAENQCITVCKIENNYTDILGVAVIENYDVVKRIGQARIAWLDLKDNSSKIVKLKKENTHLQPWLNVKIFDAVVCDKNGGIKK